VQSDQVSLIPAHNFLSEDMWGYKTDDSHLFLAKDRFIDTPRGMQRLEHYKDLRDEDLISITYEIDPSTSQIKNENHALAGYLL